MEVYTNYNYQQIQIPNNYPLYENSINELKSKYIDQSNNYFNNYPQYEINQYIHNPTEINISSNIYNIQSNEIKETNYPFENYYINNNRNTMIKIPEDKNSYFDKIPKDNLKGKHNSLKQKNNFNKINRIKILLNEYELKEKNENKEIKEKQPKDNYKKYSNENESIKNKRKNKNLNIKLNINDNNANEINNNNYNNTSLYQKNYLRTNENQLHSKKNSIKAIEHIKKNNLISINDSLSNNKKNSRTSIIKYTKSNTINNINNKTLNKSKQKSTNSLRPKINNFKKNEKELDKNYSTNKITAIKEKEKSDSNFASLINQKKLKMFSSFQQLNNTEINNEENSLNKISKIKPERMTISKNNLANKNKTINLNNNLGRLYSPQLTSSNKLENKTKTQTEIKKTNVIIKKKNTNINVNINKKLKRNISYNIDTSLSTTKKKFNSNTYLTERKIGNLSNRNVLKTKKKIPPTTKQGGGTIIRKQLSLRNSKINTEENISNNNNKLYNRNTMRFSRKKIIYSRGKNSKEKKEIIVNQKKNIFSFMKKAHKKESFHSHDKLSEDKNDMHNKSYKGFSSLKKLEEIKKKYKFFPHTKEKKNIIKDKNIDYIEESNIFSKLINSMDLNLNKSNEVRNLNLTEFLPQKIKKQNEENDEIKILENEEEEKNEENENDDMLNRKSFILDLNNVIPINEKQLRDTMNKPHLTNNSININMDFKDLK